MYVRPQKTSPPRDSSRPPEPIRPAPAQKASTEPAGRQARRRRYRILPLAEAQYSMTERATSPVFMASKASLTWSSVIVREISSSSLSSPSR